MQKINFSYFHQVLGNGAGGAGGGGGGGLGGTNGEIPGGISTETPAGGCKLDAITESACPGNGAI